MNTISRLRAAVGAGALLSAMALAACGGGGAAPTTNGSSTTLPPIVPASNQVGAAPAGIVTANGTVLSSIDRRSAQAVAVPNTIPKVVMTINAANPSGFPSIVNQLYVWAFNSGTSATVPEASLTATPTVGLALQHAPSADTSGAYGLTNDYVLSFNQPTAVGKVNITAAFADATTGIVSVDVYDSWALSCPGSGQPFNVGNVYASNSPTQTAAGTADISLDCAGSNLVFRNGAVLASAPVADTTGNVIPTITNVTAAVAVPGAGPTIFPLSSVVAGQVYVAKTSDGGFAKFEPAAGPFANGAFATLSGASLRVTSGAWAF